MSEYQAPVIEKSEEDSKEEILKEQDVQLPTFTSEQNIQIQSWIKEKFSDILFEPDMDVTGEHFSQSGSLDTTRAANGSATPFRKKAANYKPKPKQMMLDELIVTGPAGFQLQQSMQYLIVDQLLNIGIQIFVMIQDKKVQITSIKQLQDAINLVTSQLQMGGNFADPLDHQPKNLLTQMFDHLIPLITPWMIERYEDFENEISSIRTQSEAIKGTCLSFSGREKPISQIINEIEASKKNEVCEIYIYGVKPPNLALAEALSKLPNLKKVEFNNGEIDTQFLQELSKSPQLSVMNVNSCTITGDHFPAFPKLKKLNFNYNKLIEEMRFPLLTQSQNLQYFSTFTENFTPKFYEALKLNQSLCEWHSPFQSDQLVEILGGIPSLKRVEMWNAPPSKLDDLKKKIASC